MKKVTISLPDDVYRRARTVASEHGTSLSTWLRELLVDTIDAKSDFERRKRLQDEVVAAIQSFDSSDRLSRDELHHR